LLASARCRSQDKQTSVENHLQLFAKKIRRSTHFYKMFSDWCLFSVL